MPLGNLIRLLLIQVQKGKVDMEGALLILEKIVHANELNFGIIALVPVVTLVYLAFVGLNRKWRAIIGHGHAQNKAKVQELLWSLDRLLCKKEMSTRAKGKALLLMDQILRIVEGDKDFEERVLKDLISLADPVLSGEERHWVLQRLEKGIK